MNKGSTIFLKSVLVLIGLMILAVCSFVLPQAIQAELSGDFDYGLIFVGLYIPAIPFFIALFQAFKLLRFIEQNKVFSSVSVQALKNIKYCALAVTASFALGMPYILYVTDRDDAPGLVAFAFVIIFTALVITTAAGVFQNLLQRAIEIKAENDLTV
jgi:hypothetical protein